MSDRHVVPGRRTSLKDRYQQFLWKMLSSLKHQRMPSPAFPDKRDSIGSYLPCCGFSVTPGGRYGVGALLYHELPVVSPVAGGQKYCFSVRWKSEVYLFSIGSAGAVGIPWRF